MEKKQNKQTKKLSRFLWYGRSDMPNPERNSFERELQRDPFAEEALEGLSSIPPIEAENDLKELEKKLSKRIRSNKRINFYRVAASLAVLMVLSTVYITIFRNQDPNGEEKMAGSPVAFEIPEKNPIQEKISTDKQQEKKSADSKQITAPALKSGHLAESEALKAIQAEPAKEETIIAADNSARELSENQALPVIHHDKKMMEAAGAPASKQAAAPLSVSARRSKDLAAEEPINAADTDKMIITELTGAGIPEGGKEKFIEYLNDSIMVSPGAAGGKRETIVIQFNVDKSGETVNFAVTGSPDDSFTEHLINLIKNGPAWYPAEKKGILAETEIMIRITFRK